MRDRRLLQTLPFALAYLLWAAAMSLSWAQPQSVNFYSLNSTLDGDAAPVGAVVSAYDPTGVVCGTSIFVTPGTYQLLPCELDDVGTPEDEGAALGDVISFAINGLPTKAVPVTFNGTPVPSSAIITWTGMADLWEVDLSACTLAGDLDCNCRVDVADVQTIAGQWGIAPGQPGYYPPYDPNGDGMDAGDVQGVAMNWRHSCEPAN